MGIRNSALAVASVFLLALVAYGVGEDAGEAGDACQPYSDSPGFAAIESPAACNLHREERTARSATVSFFSALDDNGDGQIERKEAEAYIAATLHDDEHLDTAEEVNTAVRHMMTDLDGGDKDTSISLAEFENHVSRLLQGDRVVEWVKHGLQLPQYADSFRDNGITVGDFVLLAGPEGQSMLEEDLGVTRRLHREKISRSMKRQILNLGQQPASPQDLSCMVLNCSSIAIRWMPPNYPGNPSFHKYVLERQIQLKDGWQLVGEGDQDESQFAYTNLEPGSYEFRIVAWNSIGRSQYAITSHPCTITERCAVPNAAMGVVQPDGPEGEATSFTSWMAWLSSILTISVYSSVLLLKYGTLNPAFSASVKRRFGGLAAVQAVSRWLGMQERLETQTAGSSSIHTPPPHGSATGHQQATGEGEGDSPLGVSAHKLLSDSENSGAVGDSPLLMSMDDDSPYSQGNFQDRWEAANTLESAGLHHSASSPRNYVEEDDLLYHLSASESSEHGASAGHRSMPKSRSMSRIDHLNERRRSKDQPPLRMGSPPPSQHPQQSTVEARYCCAHTGCDRRWDQWHNVVHLRRMAQSHYCGSCQRSFCRHHTRISPHGLIGSCGLESTCYCMACYARMDPEAQARLDATNKLPPSRPGKSQSCGRSIGSNGDLCGNSHSSRPASTAASSLHSGSDAGPVHPADMQARLDELDQQLVSRQRSEANWAKARTAVNDLLKRDARKGARKPPMAPPNHAKAGTAGASARGSHSPVGASLGGSLLGPSAPRAQSPLRNQST